MIDRLRMTLRMLTVAVGVVAATAAPLAAQNVTAEDPDRILALLHAAGHSARRETTVYGDPLIRATTSDVPFVLRFYGCRNGGECLSVQFLAGFDTTAFTLAEANEWNRSMRYARAYLDENGNAFIAHDLSLDSGGIPEEVFLSSLALWEQVMARFAARIGW